MVRYGFATQHPTTLFVDVHLLTGCWVAGWR